jgi:hypothetical protein
MLALPTVKAQQKIYYTLGTKFKGLRQDQIKISSSYYHEARFVYKNQKYKVFFNPDSSLYAIEEIKNNAACPLYIHKDLSCFYHSYKLEEWIVKEYYSGESYTGVAGESRDTVVFISSPEETFDAQLIFHKGKKPTWVVLVERHGEEYWAVDWAAGVSYAAGDLWYGGSKEAFADSLEKYMVFSDKTCLSRFNNQTYNAVIVVGEHGEVISHEINNLVPYVIEDRFSLFCKSTKFPPSTPTPNGKPCCRYDFKMVVSNEKILVRF